MISPLASISPSAKIGNNVEIMPFAYIEDDVVIGDDCIIYPYASIMAGTRIGNGNKIFQNSVLGAIPQDFKFSGDKTEVIIGNNNNIRENVVINRATFKGGQTVIGDENFLMEGVHVSHDTKIGNSCVFGYGTKIAGDCEIHNSVIFSSNVIENPKTRVGKGAMIQSGCRFSKDIPPFIVATHNPIEYGGINSVILTNHGIDEKIQKHIANAYRLVFHGQTSVFDATLQIKEQVPMSQEIQDIIDFLTASKRGIISKITF
jgi:acyl-ACP--UDP-N-acetylglucosamine O-acyltransferase